MTQSQVPPSVLADQTCFLKETQGPGEIQRQVLLEILRQNQATRYGREHGFSQVPDETAFKRSVPVVRYPDLGPYIEDIQAGHEKVLTQEPVETFARTSGTTGQPKLIPVTRCGLRRMQAFFGQWLAAALADHPSMFDRHFLCLAGPAVEGLCAGGLPYGSASGIIFNAQPSWLRALSAIPETLATIDDYELRSYLVARLAYERSLSFAATPNPLTLTRLAETAMAHHETIIRSIHDGSLGRQLDSTLSLPSVQPNPLRASFLEGVLSETGKLMPRDCWPDLALIGCWLGGSIGYYASTLEAIYGPAPLRDLGYMASEGCMSLPLADGEARGVLALRQNYYEFIHESQINAPAPDCLGINDIAPGQCYKLLLTNHNGLYRYDIEDLVKVEGTCLQTPMISFQRKLGHMTNLMGEKLHLNHCLAAMSEVQEQLSIAIDQFRVVPDRDRACYEVFVAFPSGAAHEDRAIEILQVFDRALRSQNIEYDARRQSKRMKAPRMHIMDAAWPRAVKQGFQEKWIVLADKTIRTDAAHIRHTIDGGTLL